MILMAVSVNASKLVVQTLVILFLIIISAKHKYPKDGLCLATFDSIKRFVQYKSYSILENKKSIHLMRILKDNRLFYQNNLAAILCRR